MNNTTTPLTSNKLAQIIVFTMTLIMMICIIASAYSTCHASSNPNIKVDKKIECVTSADKIAAIDSSTDTGKEMLYIINYYKSHTGVPWRRLHALPKDAQEVVVKILELIEEEKPINYTSFGALQTNKI